jgi:hypothetical protein
LTDLFKIEKSSGPLTKDAIANKGNIPLITASELNNGLACRSSFKATHKAGSITVADFGHCFYQPEDFNAHHLTVLEPKFEITSKIGIFLITILNQWGYKYNFGRAFNKIRAEREIIKLPTKDGKPDWKWIQDYMNEMKVEEN